jgi:hypothetical protein
MPTPQQQQSSQQQSPPADFSSIGGKPVVTITPDSALPPGAKLVSGNVPLRLPPGATLVSGGGSAPPIDFSSIGGKPVVTITPDATQVRYYSLGQGTQEFTKGSPEEADYLQKFPGAKPIPGKTGSYQTPTNTPYQQAEAARIKESDVKAGNAMKAGAMVAGATMLPFVAPEAGVIASSLLAGAGAGAGTATGQAITGGNPLEKENLKQSGEAALGATAGGLVVGGAASFLNKILAPEVEEAASVGWQKINNTLGVKPSQIRIGPQATGIEQAATNPGRTLAKLGLDADSLSAMTPIERQATISPHLNQAGQAIRGAIDDATDAGTTLDIGKSTTALLKKIKSPQLQQQATDALSAIQHELGIQDLRNATPAEAKDFRDALKYGARFNSGGDLSSLSDVRANLYRAASGDLENAVPNLDKLNEAYSDLKAASDAARNGVAKSMVAPPPSPPPTTLQKAGAVAKKYGPDVIAHGLGVGVGYRLLRDMVGAP